MIPSHVNENTVIRPPSEVNAINRALRLMVIKLDRLMEESQPLPSADSEAKNLERRVKEKVRKSRKEGKRA